MDIRQDTPIRVLFLCTGNSCRSQMAEAILHHLGGERFEAHSAGSKPAGFVHQLAIDALEHIDVPILFAESKSWDRYKDQPIDAVITLCDAAAREDCPVFPGAPIRAHWGLPDPAYHPGTPEERQAFAVAIAQRIRSKIEAMMALNWQDPPSDLRRALQRLGEI